MAGQSSLREDLNVLRRREWERRNQETQQYRDLYQESTPLFGEPYKTNKGDELSSLIQRMLGNYEDGNSCQYDEVVRDCPPAPATAAASSLSSSCSSSLSASYRRSGHPAHRDKMDAPFQSASSYSSPQPVQGGPSQPLAYQPEFGLALGKDATPDGSRRVAEAWRDGRDSSTVPAVLSDLTPPADPLSPLHSSESSDSDHHDDDRDDGRPRSPVLSEEAPLHSQAQKEAPQAGGDALPLASQTYPLPLSSKPSLANSRKPMALVRPMDGPEQVASGSPDLKASPEDFHRQAYEGLPELKTAGKPSLPPLKMPTQSVEGLSSEVHCVEDILREMTHSWPPLLTAIHTPSTTELSKFSFPNKETHVHSGYQQPQKHHDSSPSVPISPCVEQQGVCEDGGVPEPPPTSGAECGSSSDSDSSSGSDSESSEDSESSAEENPDAPEISTSPAKAEGTKDISWQLISWIKESQQNLNSQNHGDPDVCHAPKTSTSTKAQPRGHWAEDSKSRSKRHYNSHNAPVQQAGFSHASQPSEAESMASSLLTGNRPTVSRGDAETGPRKTVGTKHPGKGRKVPPLPEVSQAGLHVESVEVTPRDKDSTFPDRPKVKTKTARAKRGKSDGHKQTKHGLSSRTEGEDVPPKATVTVEERKEAEPAPSSPAPQRLRSPLAKGRGVTDGVQTETLAPVKGSKKRRARSPTNDRKKDGSSRALAETSRPLLVKIELSQLSRVPHPPHAAKPSGTAAFLDAVPEKTRQEKERVTTGKVGKKRPAEKTQSSVPRKKVKLETESKPVPSSQHSSGKPPELKTSTEEKQKKKSKSSKKVPAPLPPGTSQEQTKSACHKRRPEEEEGSVRSGSKHRKKSANKQPEHSKNRKMVQKGSTSAQEPATSCGVSVTHRPLLKFDDKQYSVDYHMKEAKKLKHKADATMGKMGKAFSYLDAAMSFVESGVAMETDPQTPKSAYTMFSETVDLIRFILKLKNYLELTAPVSERDFLVLCMRCQALLQMAMFRCKRDSALKYLRTLTDHFKNSKTVHAPSPCVSKTTGTPPPMSPLPSPASSVGSGPAHNPGSSSVTIPQVIQQMASSYVNITALFLSAHDTWEQAEELARRGSGLLTELDRALGQLSLTSSMVSLVRYTRQGLHWLKLDASV